jgi:hypothetical protein
MRSICWCQLLTRMYRLKLTTQIGAKSKLSVIPEKSEFIPEMITVPYSLFPELAIATLITVEFEFRIEAALTGFQCQRPVLQNTSFVASELN